MHITDQVTTLRPRQNGRHFANDTFNRIFVNEKVRISIEFSLKFVSKGPINNIPALVQIMAWRRPGDKPLSEPVMVSLRTHICVTRPQWVTRPVITVPLLCYERIVFKMPSAFFQSDDRMCFSKLRYICYWYKIATWNISYDSFL